MLKAEGLTEEEEMQLREARAEQIREEKRQLMKKKHRARSRDKGECGKGHASNPWSTREWRTTIRMKYNTYFGIATQFLEIYLRTVIQ
ncbi:hypothetical protein ANCDUO_09825 [Ancylostoma duodenale]|uniref:Uncharacterized protein n=1 Tax=Ancylostoma duodenale TaxID=51022 RepID=A0A0C2DBY5_9BILA|nr:hypothetical protein ANCDUO_09825 [Ancylostoma duodenale]